MKNLIIAGLFALVFIVPDNFNLQEFLVNAKAQGITLYKTKAEDAKPDGHISLSGKNLKVHLYDSKLETPELQVTLQALVNAAISPMVTVKELQDVQWAIAKDEVKTLQEKFDALLEMEKIRRGE